jgi:transposase
LSNERIAGALQVSKGTVHNVLERFSASSLSWPLPEQLSDTALEEALYGTAQPFGKNRTAARPDVDYLQQELSRPHVTLQLLYEEYRKEHPEGLGRTAFYEHYERNRARKPDMRVVHKGGDTLFVDYSGDGLEYVERDTGLLVPVSLFVCAWGCSSHCYAEATRTQATGDFVPSQVRAFEYFGVAPHALVPDNLKSAVHKACRYDPSLNPLYRHMAEHYGIAILPARVATPKDKAVVESSVLQVQRYILARLRNCTFFSLEEINEAIARLLEELNDRPMKDYGGMSRRQRFEQNDRPYALPLPAQRFAITHFQPGLRVAPNYHIRYRDHYYSVPHRLVGKHVDVYQSGQILEIYHDNQHVCRHQVNHRKYDYSTEQEHMPAEHAFVHGWSKQYFIGEGLKIGAATAEALKQTMERQQHVQQGFNAAQGILRLGRAHTPQRLEKACERALHYATPTYRSIKSILEQHLEEQPLPGQQNQTPVPVVLHENIRGATYFGEVAA